ncbi:MAG: DUF935 family protein, partial [Alphaproteobacteria bacterium]|nr:DUF935 family protein [Alphaproteobacteria bacterium]
DVNFGETIAAPVFRMTEEEAVDKTLAERDAILAGALAQAGVALSPDYFKRSFNLSDDDLIALPNGGDAGNLSLPKPYVPQGDAPSFAATGNTFTPDATSKPAPAAPGTIANALADTADPIFASYAARAKAVTDRTTDLSSLPDALLLEFADLPVDDLMIVMTNAMTTAKLHGQTDIIAQS